MPSDPALDGYLRAVLVHGLEPVSVEIVDYDPQWPVYYEAYRDRLTRILGGRILLVEHIGSTSVPGLAAKRVIDIVIGVNNPDEEAAYLPDLEADGYQLRVREPGHRCLRGGAADMPANLHCYRPYAKEVARYLAFRDRLRAHDSDRDLYADAKRALAGRKRPDMNYYAEAKSPIIEEILRRETPRS